MELRPFLSHREIVYGALNAAIEEGWTKQSDFADDVGMSTRDVSLRLRHAECSKGYPQLAPVDWLAWIATRPVARERFLRSLAREWGYRVEPERPPTDGELLAIVAGELSEKRRRQLERERHLPEGSLG